jgi:hypothetical protein
MATKKRTRTKKKTPSASRKKKVMGDAVRMAVHNAIEMTKKAEEAKAQAELKVFAAKLIRHIAKEAGLKGPPMSVKKKVMAAAKKKATKAKKDALKKVAAAQKMAKAQAKAARKQAGM